MTKKAKLSVLDLAMQATSENITTKTKKSSILSMLHSELYNEDPKTKKELIAKISLQRLQDIFDSEGRELDAEAFTSDEVQEQFADINKTVKNGFETAVCNGKTQASYCSNKAYQDYKLEKTATGLYTITKK